jgi:hypothetical protein
MIEKDDDEALRKALIELVAKSSTGRPAADLVHVWYGNAWRSRTPSGGNSVDFWNEVS